MKNVLKFNVLLIVFTLFSSIGFSQTNVNDVTIIELTQTPGQFETKKLHLKPGKYQFRVVNKGVDKEVGFVIQEASEKGSDIMKNHVENSFSTSLIKNGDAAYTGVVNLKEGSYNYLCPLNPTPHYKIIVD